MDYTGTIVEAKKGDLVCRPAIWVDVVKFFMMNYVLHAFTVITPPGSGVLETIAAAVMSIVAPFSGIYRAAFGIVAFSQSRPTDLDAAHEAGALCMMVPAAALKDANPMPKIISPSLHQIHGYHPVKPVSILEKWFNSDITDPEDLDDNIIVVVPLSFKVKPFEGPEKSSRDPPRYPALWSSSSLLKALVSILQIMYGCFELYAARGNQLARFGYAAYSLSVIPYVLMSLSNLISSLFTPSYPTLYPVNYRRTEAPKAPAEGRDPLSSEKIETEPSTVVDVADSSAGWVDGAVGEAYGSFLYPPFVPSSHRLAFLERSRYNLERAVSPTRSVRHRFIMAVIGITFFLILMASPEYIVYILTEFKARQSTTYQQKWAIAWLALSQYFGPIALIVSMPIMGSDLARKFHPHGLNIRVIPNILFFIKVITCLVFAGVGAGAFHSVAQMLLSDVACVKV